MFHPYFCSSFVLCRIVRVFQDGVDKSVSVLVTRNIPVNQCTSPFWNCFCECSQPTRYDWHPSCHCFHRRNAGNFSKVLELRRRSWIRIDPKLCIRPVLIWLCQIPHEPDLVPKFLSLQGQIRVELLHMVHRVVVPKQCKFKFWIFLKKRRENSIQKGVQSSFRAS